jgi:50S ribosomal protein L16 3-hydroxylase
MAWFGQFMTEPRYPELLQGEDLQASQLQQALDEGAMLVRNPSARLAWAELGDELMLFASGQGRLLGGELRELLQLLCQAPALHADNLAPWLQQEEAHTLLLELIKQGSLEFADE